MGSVLFIIALCVLLFLVLLGYQAVRNWNKAALIRDTPLTPINQLAPGLAKVLGQAVALSGTVPGPLTMKPCIYYRFKVREKRTHAGPHGGSSYWVTIINDGRILPCGLDDGTGVAALELGEAELLLTPATTARSGFLNDAPAELERMLKERYGKTSRGILFNKTLSYSETRVMEGDRLLVVGTVELTEGGNAQFVRGTNLFLITDRLEDKLIRQYRSRTYVCALVGVVILLVFGVVAAWIKRRV
jgi:hypothetical protein